MKRIFTSLLTAFAVLASVYTSQAQWSIVGSAGISGAVANHVDMAVDANGVPYIAYADNSKGDKLTVKKWDGNNWVSVGGTGVSPSSVEHVSIGFDGVDLFVAFSDNDKGGRASVMRYKSWGWSFLGNQGFTSQSVDYTSIAINASGKVHVGYSDGNQSGKATVAAYDGSGWVAAGNQVGFSSGQASYTSLTMNSSADLYLAYRDHANNNKLTVKRSTGNGWYTVGSSGVSAGSVSNVSAKFDSNNNLYVVYQDGNNGNKATVMKWDGSNWSTVGSAGFTPSGAGSTDIDFLASGDPVVVYRDDNNNQKASVMLYNGSSWTNVGSAGFSSNTVDYTSIAVDGSKIYVGFKDNAVSQKATVMSTTVTVITSVTWTGNKNTNWNDIGNWTNGTAPSSSISAVIPSGRSRYPIIVNSAGTAICNNINIQSGGSVTLNGGTLDIRGSITQNGTLDAEDGYIVLKGNSAQSIPANTFKNNTVKELELNNSAGCSLGGTLNITKAYYPTSGVLNTNDHLVLKSDSNGTARIASGGSNYITGDVTTELYIAGGRRAFRFFSHPFSTAIKLSQLLDDIDITGQGGSTNGFTPVQVNAPSAFWFDVTTADNSTAGNNPGWKDFRSAVNADWDQHEMARIFIRGSKGQGLVQGAYTPDAVTLDMKGPVNQGSGWLYYPKGSNSNFITCGNPYPSPVNLKHVYRYNVSSYFCVWNPRQGTMGGYTAHYFSNDYVLPINGAFVTTVTSGSTGYMYYSENYKTDATPANNQFKGTAAQYTVELTVEDDDHYWDKLFINYDDTLGMAVQDTFDFVQLNNPELDFYSKSADNEKLTVDTRPYDKNDIIPVGIDAYQNMSTKIKVAQLNIPAGVTLYLHDKYLNKVEPLQAGMEYNVDIDTAIAGTLGDRFYISSSADPVAVEEISNQQTGRMQLIPNPATDMVKLTFDRIEGVANVRVTSVTGRVVYAAQVNTQQGAVSIPLSDIPSGMYTVELQSENTRIVEKLIKR